jgi:hypothetical protein
MGVEDFAVLAPEANSGAGISLATVLQVGLEEEPLHLATLVLLLGLDLVEGEL